MFLENVVTDAADPQRLGRFWEAVVGGERLTDEPDGFETRLAIDGGPVLDLCFQRVAEPAASPPRVQLHVFGGSNRPDVVDRLLRLGARQLDADGSDAAAMELADPEGNQFCVVGERPEYVDSGPVAAISLASANPDEDAAFWSWLSGWTAARDTECRRLRHPSMLGPVLEFETERRPKGTSKNRLHLDVRLDVGDDADDVAAGIFEKGGREFFPDWGELPWRVYTDPSGNEFCVLSARPDLGVL